MKKIIVFLTFICLLFWPSYNVLAGRGCCSRHGGVCGCTMYGMSLCCDGDTAKAASCACTPPKVYGCTDAKANNYNPNANTNDGSCTYAVYGCKDIKANNYNSLANVDDGSCTYDILGCTDISAINYLSSANKDDGSCEYNRNIMTEESDNNANDNDKKITKSTTSMKNGNSGRISTILFWTFLTTASIGYFIGKTFRRGKEFADGSICNNCGTINNSNSTYCYKCGKKN